jgi:hypothetical protein
MVDVGAQPIGERLAGIGVGLERFADYAQRFDFADADRDQEVPAVGKVAVQGRVADPGPAGDFV